MPQQLSLKPCEATSTSTPSQCDGAAPMPAPDLVVARCDPPRQTWRVGPQLTNQSSADKSVNTPHRRSFVVDLTAGKKEQVVQQSPQAAPHQATNLHSPIHNPRFDRTLTNERDPFVRYPIELTPRERRLLKHGQKSHSFLMMLTKKASFRCLHS